MKKTYCRRLWAAGIACALMYGGASAQEAEFDLSSQRSEIQNVLPVPGKKLDHKGIIINPTPQVMTLSGGKHLDISGGIAVKDKQKTFANDLDFVTLNGKGVKLNIDFGAKAARKLGVKETSGAYALTIDEKGISIMGYDERGAYYGLQTLCQVVESPAAKGGQLPCLTINDYPTLPRRGVIEGFYGTPWSHAVRLSLMDFMGKYKLNTYFYGPKDDPYHSCPNWRLPYPEKEAQNIRELVEACNKNRVEFVWAIHPGADIKWNEEDYQNLVNKFQMMYDLGVSSFTIFFDDISGEGTNPLKQTELLNRLNKEFVQAKGDVAPLNMCPTDYSRLWANPTEQGSLALFGKNLDPSINIFWTGDVVCSDFTRETMEWVNSRIKRPAYYWWNYPVTDYCRHIIMQGPSYGLDTTLTDQDACGICSNPMEHGEASKLALYGMADYAWNVANYNALDSWERGLAELVPQATEAYRTFAIHSADTENGYRRDESWETKTFRWDEWSDEAADQLEKEFVKVANAPAELEKGCTNQLLLGELRPWLVEFGKLGVRGQRAIELARLYRSGEACNIFWEKYLQNLMTPEEREAYEKHKSGTMKLQPFYEYLMEDMGSALLQSLTGEVPNHYKGIGSFATAATPQTKLMLDNDSTTFYTSGFGQNDGDWLGLDLKAVRDVSEIAILQGRNSVNDVDYFDHVRLECSADGKNWTTLKDDMKKQYIINWTGEPVKARYVRLMRMDSEKKNYAAIRSFEVNPLRADKLGFQLEAEQPQEALFAFDQNLSTAYQNKGTLSWEVTPEARAYLLLMNRLDAPLKCTQTDAKGKVISETILDTPFGVILVSDGNVAKVSIEGAAEIFEIITERGYVNKKK